MENLERFHGVVNSFRLSRIARGMSVLTVEGVARTGQNSAQSTLPIAVRRDSSATIMPTNWTHAAQGLPTVAFLAAAQVYAIVLAALPNRLASDGISLLIYFCPI